MSKAAAKKTTTPKEDEIQKVLDAQVAKTQFIGSTLNLSWKLAFAVLIPIIGGIKLDQHFNTSPSLVLTGFMIAMVAAALTIKSTVQEVDELQAEADKKGKRKK